MFALWCSRRVCALTHSGTQRPFLSIICHQNATHSFSSFIAKKIVRSSQHALYSPLSAHSYHYHYGNSILGTPHPSRQWTQLSSLTSALNGARKYRVHQTVPASMARPFYANVHLKELPSLANSMNSSAKEMHSEYRLAFQKEKMKQTRGRGLGRQQ
jgi:hypothetical protein